MINRLKELRLKNGLTLSELSKNVNIPTSTLSKYENQKRNLIGINLYKLSEYFSVSPSYLTGDDPLENVTLMTNLDDDNLIPFETHTVSGKQSTIAINQVLKWLDNDKMLLYTDKRQKTAYSREHELALLKEMHTAFENMRDSMQIGMDRNVVPNENDYVHSLDMYTSAMKILWQFIGLDSKSQKSISQLVDKLAQNKKASDD